MIDSLKRVIFWRNNSNGFLGAGPLYRMYVLRIYFDAFFS